VFIQGTNTTDCRNDDCDNDDHDEDYGNEDDGNNNNNTFSCKWAVARWQWL
jgi:hypothetical protein